jgi:leucyl aminopeptidase
MALADTLVLAAREQPELIIDYATLTGSCVQALTERYSGVFTNRAALNPVLIDTGIAAGERVWPFPMDKDFDEDLKSSVADILQCAVDGTGDHIHAARFLQRFVPDSIPWVHMDLSASSRKSELAQIPPGTTGFGVRFTLSLVLDHGDTVKQAANAIEN